MRRRSRGCARRSTTPLPVLPETPLNTFSHYARLSGMAPAPLALARRVVQACGTRLRGFQHKESHKKSHKKVIKSQNRNFIFKIKK
jgi:hypothetical protein